MPCVAGDLVNKELDAFSQVIGDKVQRPLTAIVGGAKISDKVLEKNYSTFAFITEVPQIGHARSTMQPSLVCVEHRLFHTSVGLRLFRRMTDMPREREGRENMQKEVYINI